MSQYNSNGAVALMMRRLFILGGLTLIGLFVTLLAVSVITKSPLTTPILRVSTVIQDVMVFILPSIALAMICSRNAPSFLSIDKAPDVRVSLLAVMALIVSAPFQNCIIAWNESLQLPEFMSALERSMVEAEQRASEATTLLMGGTTVGDLVMGILIMGIFAGLSEELFFRGALQRIIARNSRASHAAIWIAAVVFSAFHFQFYGFFPRLLLGVYFGYLVWWSRSLWVPVIVHAINNTFVVTTGWISKCRGIENPVETIGVDSPGLVAVSVAITVAAIFLIYRITHRPDKSVL